MKVAGFCVLFLFALGIAGEFTVTIPFDPGTVRITREGSYDAVEVPGLPTVFTEGAPRLPVMPAKVALPTGSAAVSIEIVRADYTTLAGAYNIQPATASIPISLAMDHVQAPPDSRFYDRDRAFPVHEAVLTSSSVFWGIPLAYVSVHPVRWNPADRTLQVLNELTLRVAYETDPSVNLVSRRTASSESMAMDIVSRLVVNPEMVSPSGAILVEPRDLAYGQYVIVTHPDFLAQAQELADWKTSKGIPAKVYTTTWIQSQYTFTDLQQEIRAFLTDCRDQGTDYVLIFGDNSKVQCRQAKFVGDASFSTMGPTDLYFVDINDTAPGADFWDANGNGIWGEVPYPYQHPQPGGYDQVDYHPDLWVGRASVGNSSEADIFINKVFLYEGIQRADYFETAPRELRIGYTTGILWYSPYIPGSASAESISTFVPSSLWEEEKLYESNGTNSAANTIAMINAMPHHVYHASHGSENYMWTSQGSNYTVAHIMAQTNIQSGGLPAIWQSIACLIGAMDYGSGDCCAEAWLASPNGGGFGCFNSRYGFGNFAGPCKGPSEMLCIRFYQDHWENDIYILGIAHGTSMDFYSPPDSTYMDWCLKAYNLFGDPELPMWTEVPSEIAVVHPSSINQAGTIAFTVTQGGSPVENARVCLQKGDWQTGDIYEVAYTNSSGIAEIYVNPETTGTISATVWARNHHTYQGGIEVIGTSIERTPPPIVATGFLPAFPNPAREVVSLAFSLSGAGPVTLDVYDLTGRKVAALVNGELTPGNHNMTWNLTDEGGRPVPAGFYVARFTASGFSSTSRFMVVR
jgi:hypothetical protein